MMYYTMRGRCAQRQFDELKAKLRQNKKDQIQLPEERIWALTHTLRNVGKYANELAKLAIKECVC